MKPELTGLSVLTALCGFYLGSSGVIDVTKMFYTALGTLLVGGAAGTLNQYLERDFDLLMKRTERRPLPAGRLKPVAALGFGIALAFTGLFVLRAGVNFLAYLVALLTLLSYLFIYTPLKRKSTLNTVVGAIPGALPTLIGWSAASGEITLPGIAFFAVLFAWQIPHFLSLAWMYRRDYGRAGFKMLPVVDEGGGRTVRNIIGYSLILLLASLSMTFLHVSGYYYLIGSVILGVGFLIPEIQFYQALRLEGESATAKLNMLSRRIFFLSLAYLPCLMLLMVIDKL